MKAIISLTLALLILSGMPLGLAVEEKESALLEIERANECIASMEEKGFPSQYAKDLLAQAEDILGRADLAANLPQMTGSGAELAEKTLANLPEKEKSYSGALETAESVCAIEQEAYYISDSLTVFRNRLEEYQEPLTQEDSLGNLLAGRFAIQVQRQLVDTSEAEALLEQAQKAFGEERYGEAELLFLEAQANLEEKEAEITVLNVVAAAGTSFFERYWVEIIIFLAVIAAVGRVAWRRLHVKRTRKKIFRLNVEKKTLLHLMKKAQEDRFKKVTLPESLYSIKMGKYQERMAKVKETLPVLEASLKRSKKSLLKKIRPKKSRFFLFM